MREADPNVHRNSEPHIFMPGGNLIYVYHTLRYSDLTDHAAEDIGVDVLSLSPSFRLPMVVINQPVLDPGQTISCSSPGWCDYQSKTIHLDHVSEVSFTVSWNWEVSGSPCTPMVTLSVLTAPWGELYDTVPVFQKDFKGPLESCISMQAPCRYRYQSTTQPMALPGRFAKVQVEIPKKYCSIANLTITAVLINL